MFCEQCKSRSLGKGNEKLVKKYQICHKMIRKLGCQMMLLR